MSGLVVRRRDLLRLPEDVLKTSVSAGRTNWESKLALCDVVIGTDKDAYPEAFYVQ